MLIKRKWLCKKNLSKHPDKSGEATSARSRNRWKLSYGNTYGLGLTQEQLCLSLETDTVIFSYRVSCLWISLFLIVRIHISVSLIKTDIFTLIGLESVTITFNEGDFIWTYPHSVIFKAWKASKKFLTKSTPSFLIFLSLSTVSSSPFYFLSYLWISPRLTSLQDSEGGRLWLGQRWEVKSLVRRLSPFFCPFHFQAPLRAPQMSHQFRLTQGVLL